MASERDGAASRTMNSVSSTANPSAASVTNLRQLSRDYAQGSITFEEYRHARARLLDGLASGELPVTTYRPPPPPLPAQVVRERSSGDTDPTLRMHRPRPLRGWLIILLALGLTLAVLAAILR
ncbi:MAG: hypothetical protein ACT4NU_13145 [Chromatiales bacterium]